MPSLTAPFYGNIKSFTVDPQDNSLWVITENPLGGSIAPTQIFVQDLIQTKRPNDCVKTHFNVSPITSAYGHDSGLYLTSKEGIVYKKENHCPKIRTKMKKGFVSLIPVLNGCGNLVYRASQDLLMVDRHFLNQNQ